MIPILRLLNIAPVTCPFLWMSMMRCAFICLYLFGQLSSVGVLRLCGVVDFGYKIELQNLNLTQFILVNVEMLADVVTRFLSSMRTGFSNELFSPFSFQMLIFVCLIDVKRFGMLCDYNAKKDKTKAVK